MEVLKQRVTMLTNQEVLSFLNEVKKEENSKQHGDRCKMLATVVYETKKYLNASPAVTQNEAVICELIPKLAPFKLTGAETLQVINLRPANTTDVQLLIEETEERFPLEDELEKLVTTVSECLPPPPKR
uniref:DNA-directed RNA polymerase III subunit RPC9 n=1 Tax=Caenorhabditis tropicalis TaxID=1561998 RepID=A0A1I7THT1_9PELO